MSNWERVTDPTEHNGRREAYLGNSTWNDRRWSWIRPHLPPELLQRLQSTAVQLGMNPLFSISLIPSFSLLCPITGNSSTAHFWVALATLFVSFSGKAKTRLVSFSAEQILPMLYSWRSAVELQFLTNLTFMSKNKNNINIEYFMRKFFKEDRIKITR